MILEQKTNWIMCVIKTAINYRDRFIKSTNTSIPPQINYSGILVESDGATILFIAEKQQKLF